MTILRRVLLLWLFMFWQGGFLFYGAVVVTIGSKVLDSDREQGFITREVTEALNLAGLVVLVAWLWDLLAERASRRKRRWAAWLFLVLSLAVLFGLHARMDTHLDPQTHQLRGRGDFRQMHRWYLRLSTVQWLASIAFTTWTLQNWRATDRNLSRCPPGVSK